jgi:dihydropteroate synthase
LALSAEGWTGFVTRSVIEFGMLERRSTPPRRARRIELYARERPLVMAIMNVTPDSFSDGGQFLDALHAIAYAKQLATDGADFLDVGAESTRPYAGVKPVPFDEELARLTPVLPGVIDVGLPVSIDTMKARIADWALELGAEIVNDVWGLQRDEDMARVVAAHDAAVIVMHNRERPDGTVDIMTEVKKFFDRSLEIAGRAGIDKSRIVLDPGVGFGKTPEQSMTVIARLQELGTFGLPLLVGLSRKKFIDAISPAPADRRLGGSIAANVLAAIGGADIVRVHDVAETVQAMRVTAAIRSAK